MTALKKKKDQRGEEEELNQLKRKHFSYYWIERTTKERYDLNKKWRKKKKERKRYALNQSGISFLGSWDPYSSSSLSSSTDSSPPPAIPYIPPPPPLLPRGAAVVLVLFTPPPPPPPPLPLLLLLTDFLFGLMTFSLNLFLIFNN